MHEDRNKVENIRPHQKTVVIAKPAENALSDIHDFFM